MQAVFLQKNTKGNKNQKSQQQKANEKVSRDKTVNTAR